MNKPLKYWDRYKNEIRKDQVYADWFVRWCYEKKIGRFFLNYFFSKRNFNILYGLYKNSKFSLKQIHKDIREYSVDMDLFNESEFRSYSDFFLRTFKPNIRMFPSHENELGAIGEGRVLAFNQLSESLKFPVKGKFLNASSLLQNRELAQKFDNGPLIIIRLCPIDYHHFHFPDNGKITSRYRVGGQFHSVNVLALKNKEDIFLQNEREITILETDNFGTIAMIEVGAMCVGKIKQDFRKSTSFKRGERKGHFEFGASTVIILGQENRFKISEDIIENSQKNIESYIKLGDTVASRISK